MKPINFTSILLDNWVFLLIFLILLGCLYSLVQFRGNQKKRALLWGKMPGTCAVREMMMKSLAEKLGLRFAATDVSALGGGFPNLKLFQHSTPVGEKIQGRADKIFGGVYGDETPIIRFRNIVKGIVDDSTITIFDHHFSKASPKKSQTVIVLQSCTFRTPSITIRPKSQMHDVTGVAATNRIKVTDNSAFNDHYIVETNYSAYSHIIDPELIAELANSPFLWIEASDDVLAICRHGTNADLDEILALLDLGMKVKRNLVKLEAVVSC